MHPARPNFLPANRIRRQLDPTRRLKSRELWNQVRYHSAPVPNESTRAAPSSKRYYLSLIRAILYEIQPFRIKPAFRRFHTFMLEEDGLKQSCTYCIERIKSTFMLVFYCIKCIYQFIKSVDVKSIKSFIGSKLVRYSALTCAGLYVYGRFLAYMHEWLHAGPMVFILTCLVLIYTIGLGDNTGASSGVPSAYSVFNRGVQRPIGQEDAETLANQFVRAAAGRGLDVGGAERNERGFGNIWIGDDEPVENNDDEQEVINERRRRRRLERLQQRNADIGENGQHVDNNTNMQQENDDQADLEPEEDLQQNDNVAGARKSGKKARRRNLEVRREMQRQRQAAAAMGFGVDEGMNIRDINALDQFVDD